jgi:hypothetical protein
VYRFGAVILLAAVALDAVSAGDGAGSASAQTGAGRAVDVPQLPPPSPQARPSLLAPIVATGASAAVGGFAIGFFFAARSSARDAGATSSHAEYEALVEKTVDRKHASWVLGGIAGAGAIVSGVLWYRYASAPRIEVQASRSAAGVTVSGSW